MNIFEVLFYEPTFNLLIFFYDLLGQNLGLAILIVAAVTRLLTYPLTRRQIKSAEKNQEFQKRMTEVKKKYKHNEEQQAKELAKIQAEFLPAQLGGCLNLIISLIFLIQVRNVIVNLVNEGAHAFNEVAYVESLKLKEDSVSVQLPGDLGVGDYDLELDIAASNGAGITSDFRFAVVENEDEKEAAAERVVEYNKSLPEEEVAASLKLVRENNISVYIPEFEDGAVVMTDQEQLRIFLRAPSDEVIVYDSLQVRLNGETVEAENISYTQGEPLDLDFLGADLSRVATDIGFANVWKVLPYVLIAVAMGASQFGASKIQMGLNPTTAAVDQKNKDKNKEKANKKKGKKDDEQPDFSEMMAQSSRQMIYFFPILTIAMSLGFLGGASFFPTGVSLFWTGQNTFVIIQQLLENRVSVAEKLRSWWTKRPGRVGAVVERAQDQEVSRKGRGRKR